MDNSLQRGESGYGKRHFAGLMTLRPERGFRYLNDILKRPRKTKQDFQVSSVTTRRWMGAACSIPRHPRPPGSSAASSGDASVVVLGLGLGFPCARHLAVLDSTGEGVSVAQATVTKLPPKRLITLNPRANPKSPKSAKKEAPVYPPAPMPPYLTAQSFKE